LLLLLFDSIVYYLVLQWYLGAILFSKWSYYNNSFKVFCWFPNFTTKILVGPLICVSNTGSAVDSKKCISCFYFKVLFITSSWRILLQTAIEIADFKIDCEICILTVKYIVKIVFGNYIWVFGILNICSGLYFESKNNFMKNSYRHLRSKSSQNSVCF